MIELIEFIANTKNVEGKVCHWMCSVPGAARWVNLLDFTESIAVTVSVEAVEGNLCHWTSRLPGAAG